MLNDDQLDEVNHERRKQGRRELSRAEAERAARERREGGDEFDLASFLTFYVGAAGRGSDDSHIHYAPPLDSPLPPAVSDVGGGSSSDSGSSGSDGGSSGGDGGGCGGGGD